MAGRGALVLEDAHHVWTGSPTPSLVSANLLPELEGTAPCVILAHRVPPANGAWNGRWRSASELRVPPRAVERVLDDYAPALTPRARDRAVALIGGGAGGGARRPALPAAPGARPEPPPHAGADLGGPLAGPAPGPAAGMLRH